MRRILALAILAGALAGCQGLVGASGGFSGLTVPPGCKAQGSFSYPMPQGAISFSCDETGAVAAAPAPKAMAEAPAIAAPTGAHLTVDRQ